jgi:hypothetical protein
VVAPVLGMLLAANLACRSPEPDINATVNAVSTAVEMTLVALTQPVSPAPGTPLVPTPTQPTPTATDFVPPEATTPAPPTQTHEPPPPGVVARPNGPVLDATRRESPPSIDAQLDDWSVPLPYRSEHNVFRPENWTGPGDSSASFAVGWDTTYLYLALDVVDDVHVQADTGLTLYRGDSIELQFDADLPGDFNVASLNQDDFQIGFSPGADGNTPEVFMWNPAERRGVPQGVQIAARLKPEGAGYVLEAAIPWSLFNVTPQGGVTFGFALNVSDNDTPGTQVQESMVSSVNTRTLLDPTTWGTLRLAP